MSEQHRTTAPDAAPAPYRWEAKHPAEAARIRASNTLDLTVMADAFGSGIDGMLCILNQPRCDSEGDAYGWIEDEMERAGLVREMIFEEIRRRPSDGSYHHEDAIRKLLAYDLGDCGEGFIEAMATLSRLAAEHEAKCGEIKRVAMGLAA